MVTLTEGTAQGGKALPLRSQDLFVDAFGAIISLEDLDRACGDFRDDKIEKAENLKFKDVQLNALLASFDGYLTTSTIVHKSPGDKKRS